MNNNTSIGLGTLLGVVFITLKLTGVITWPWVWITAPLWIPWAIAALVIGVPLAALFIGWCILWGVAKFRND